MEEIRQDWLDLLRSLSRNWKLWPTRETHFTAFKLRIEFMVQSFLLSISVVLLALTWLISILIKNVQVVSAVQCEVGIPQMEDGG